jgi:transcriptional regulator with XRE-family HTH domain
MSDQILKYFGHAVREERLRQGLSQEEFASKAGLH